MDYINLASLPRWDAGLLVLMYHLIERPPLRYPLRALYVEPGTLRAQLSELQESGAAFISLSQWKPDNRRQVAVTFDDAFQNILHNALPVLVELKISAVTYVVVDLIGQINSWDRVHGVQVRALMTRDELLAWKDAGQEIGSHGLSHRSLTEISATEARREIFESKARLEDMICLPVRHFCYPYGHCNAQIRDFVAEAGYETATATSAGYSNTEKDRFALHRYLARHQKPFQEALRGLLPF